MRQAQRWWRPPSPALRAVPLPVPGRIWGALPFLLLAAAADPPEKPPPTPSQHLRQVVVDAIRNCPQSHGDEIAVCAPDRGIAEGYRIPKMDPRFATNLRPSGRGELTAAEAAATGIGSCSKVGPGGGIGCSAKEYRAWKAQRDRDRAAKAE